MSTDRLHAQRCMEQVQAYRASGMKAKAWAEANGVPTGNAGQLVCALPTLAGQA